MSREAAVIRPYTAADKKLVQFMVSKANFQTLAVANKKIYLHPITIAVWLALSAAMIQYTNMWPGVKFGFLEYFRPLPALASMAVPIMFLVDWKNRPYFEDFTQQVLRHEDLKDIAKYYSANPASGFWILELGKNFVGLIAVDASQPKGKPAKGEDALPKTAIIRHFHVEENFQKANIQADLLKFAVEHTFNKDTKLARIEASDSPLVPYLRPCLREAGFELDHHTKTVGLLQWNLGVRYLERKNWEKKTN